MEYLMLIGAIIMMCVAHLVRTARWQLFVKVYEKPQTRNLIQGLTLGYLINYIVPFKLGDLFRAWYSGRKMKNGVALGLSTVIVDRYLDVISVGLIFVGLSVFGIGGGDIKKSAWFYIILTAALVVATILVYLFRGVLKKVLRAVASLFNECIESFILFFFWALIWNFSDIFKKINKLKLILYTIGMWVLYVGSYYFFAEFLYLLTKKGSWTDVFTMFFTSNGIKSSTIMLSDNTVLMLIYMLVPLAILFAISFFFKKVNVGENTKGDYVNLLPQLNDKEKLVFLDNYFSNNNKEYVDNYLEINRNISIIRDYSAGSNATTMLCMDDEQTFFRKYAFGADGAKLYDQVEWLEKYKNEIALPDVIRKKKEEGYCFYDMPYENGAVGFFEYIHSMPVGSSWEILKNVLDKLENSIYQLDKRATDGEMLDAYIDKKVLANIEKIKKWAKSKSIWSYDTIVINGTQYKNMKAFEDALSKENLKKIFENDDYSVIHGDLTVENIIVVRDEQGRDDFYIIDPNTGNLHDSPNLDYAKMLQSIHGGYEFLMSTKDLSVTDNNINYIHTKSSAYIALRERLHNYMVGKFGEDRVKSIYYHEIVHWLRLMPYKIDNDGKRAMLFYAGMVMVMNDIIK